MEIKLIKQNITLNVLKRNVIIRFNFVVVFQREEEKRKEKIENWDAHVEGRGYSSKYKPVSTETETTHELHFLSYHSKIHRDHTWVALFVLSQQDT